MVEPAAVVDVTAVLLVVASRDDVGAEDVVADSVEFVVATMVV